MCMFVADRKRAEHGEAFTLVELLVVVSIIALLIAILLPSLQNARRLAKRAACRANVRSIAQAGLTYAVEDPHELAIPIGEGDGHPLHQQVYYSYVGFGGKSGLGVTGSTRESLWSGNNLMASVHRPMNELLYPGGLMGGTPSRSGGISWSKDAKQSLSVYHCPADRGFPGFHQIGWEVSGLSGYDYFGTSYACNPLFVGYPGEGERLQSNGMYLRPVSRTPSPSNTVLYWEYAARYATFAANTGDYDQSGCYWGSEPYTTWADYTAKGHHGRDFHFNTSFADGHTAWVQIKGHGRVGIGDQDRKMPPSCQGGVCNCIFLRGLGWQLDTLPAELVRTHKVRSDSGDSMIPGPDGESVELFDVVDR